MPNDRELLISFLTDHDEWCEQCGYALRGLNPPANAGLTCPECGVGLALRVGASRPPLGSWLLALISCSLGAGFDGVVATVMWGAIAIQRGKNLPWEVYAVAGTFMVLALLCVTGIRLLIVKREGWFRGNHTTRWRRAWIVSGTVFLVHAGWGLFLITRS